MSFWQAAFNAIVAHVEKNWEFYSSGAALLGIGAITSMPVVRPKTLDDLWTWARNTLQAATPARFHAPDPTPGAIAPKEK